jgi:hypothetical protein
MFKSPDTLSLGRNGSIGSLSVDWSRVPQEVLGHIASVYFPQYITDAANAGGKNETAADRLARAQKKLDTMYAGNVRTRVASAEPIDPIDAEAHRMAKAALTKKAKQSPAWSVVPKKLRKSDAGIVHALNGMTAEGDPTRDTIADWVAYTLERNPDNRFAAFAAFRASTGSCPPSPCRSANNARSWSRALIRASANVTSRTGPKPSSRCVHVTVLR